MLGPLSSLPSTQVVHISSEFLPWGPSLGGRRTELFYLRVTTVNLMARSRLEFRINFASPYKTVLPS